MTSLLFRVLLQWQNVNMEQRRIWVKQFKTGKEVTIPMAPDLFTALQEAEAWRVDQYVCPKCAERYNRVDEVGKNVGNNLIDLDALRVIRWIGLEPSVPVPGRKKKMTVYGFHSLRHSFASFCATAGVPKATLLSWLYSLDQLHKLLDFSGIFYFFIFQHWKKCRLYAKVCLAQFFHSYPFGWRLKDNVNLLRVFSSAKIKNF